MSIAYLGPEGTFTHEAAVLWAASAHARTGESIPLVALSRVSDVYRAVAAGDHEYGMVAIENTVEGYVVPSLDAIVDSPDVVAVDETVLRITFDAFVRPGHGELTEVSAHPHGLAQCQGFVSRTELVAVPAASNAAACRDVGDHQVALGPPICGDLYGLTTLEGGVEDYHDARTRFLTLVRRGSAPHALHRWIDRSTARRTMLAITPTTPGPGVLARITDAFGVRGVNLSSLITRPLKTVGGWYVFVLTVDAAPWEPAVRSVLEDLMAAGDSVKTLGVFPAGTDLVDVAHGTVDEVHVPVGGVGPTSSADERDLGLLWV